MAASGNVVKFACAFLLCMVVAAPHAEAAISCATVTQHVAQCLSYLKGGAMAPACCGGLKSLNMMASSPADRRTACGCLKNAANAITGIDAKKAAGLPGQCGISIPYPISRNTDCSKVH